MVRSNPTPYGVGYPPRYYSLLCQQAPAQGHGDGSAARRPYHFGATSLQRRFLFSDRQSVDIIPVCVLGCHIATAGTCERIQGRRGAGGSAACSVTISAAHGRAAHRPRTGKQRSGTNGRTRAAPTRPPPPKHGRRHRARATKEPKGTLARGRRLCYAVHSRGRCPRPVSALPPPQDAACKNGVR